MEKKVGGSTKKSVKKNWQEIKICGGGRVQRNFPFRPPHDLKWNSPKDEMSAT